MPPQPMKTYDLLEITPDCRVLINGVSQPETVEADDLRGSLFRLGKHRVLRCNYCGSLLERLFWEREDDIELWEPYHGWKWSQLVSCESCRCWEWHPERGYYAEGVR